MSAPSSNPPTSSTTSTSSIGAGELRVEIEKRIKSGALQLPILPQTAVDVLAVCGDSSCDAQRLAELIQRDQALAGRALSVANSTAYAPLEPIVSLQQAVSRLGFRAMCDIAVAVALKGKVFKLEGQEARIRQLWAHSALAGAWAKEIARARRRNVEGAFLCGLLHDVGKPVVLQAAIEVLHAARARMDEGLLDELGHEFHARVGAELLLKWKLPEWMVVAGLHHHDPDNAGEHVDLARTTSLADLLAHASTRPDPAADDVLKKHPLLADLSLYGDEFQALLARRDKVKSVARSFA